MPMTVDVGMVQGGRSPFERDQVMNGVEDLFASAIATIMTSDDPPVRHDLDVIDVALDGHVPKGIGSGDAVVVVVEADGLVLIDLGFLADTGVEPPVGER